MLPFTFEIIDPSGNSFVQNPNAPNVDPQLNVTYFDRSLEDYATMGYNVDEAAEQQKLEAAQKEAGSPDGMKKTDSIEKAIQSSMQSGQIHESNSAVKQTKEEQEYLLAKMATYQAKKEVTAAGIDFSKPIDQQDESEGYDPKKEVTNFQTFCESCGSEGLCKMCVATIPYFSEIIIMAFSCDKCGYRSSEIKQGGGIPDKATKIEFTAERESDLSRDLFKSDSCMVEFPDLGCQLQPGTQGSMYTTVEGLFSKVIDHLADTNPFGRGDSVTNVAFLKFLDEMKARKDGKVFPFTIILDDPLSNCFIYNPNAPNDDPQLKITVYERTEEQNDDLGITDMNV